MPPATAVLAASPYRPLFLLPKSRSAALWLTATVMAVLIVSTTMGSASQPAPPPPHPAASWPTYQADGFQFAYPAGWSVTPHADGYVLTPPDEATGTRITVTWLPATARHLAGVEKLGLASVEQNTAISRHYLRILPRTRVDNRPAGRIRYTADLASGERVEGVWNGALLPDGRVLAFTLTSYPGTPFKTVYGHYKRLLRSVALLP